MVSCPSIKNFNLRRTHRRDSKPKAFVRGDIHTNVVTLNVNMTLESDTPTPPPLCLLTHSINVRCGNKCSFNSVGRQKSHVFK